MQIIYDFDGVMFDSRESVELMYHSLSSRLDITLTREQLDYCYSHSMADNVRNIFGDKAWTAIKEIPYARYYRYANIMPGLRLTLEALHKAGIEISICSNRVSGIAYILDVYGLSTYISNVSTSKEYPAKPNPEGLLSLIDGESWFVGDSETDSRTATNADIGFISYNNKRIRADYHISNHLEILSLTPIKEYGIRIAGGK